MNSKGPEVVIIPLTSKETDTPGSFEPLSSGHTGEQLPVEASLSIHSVQKWSIINGLGGPGQGWTCACWDSLQLLLDSASHELVSVCRLFLLAVLLQWSTTVCRCGV